MTSTSDGEDKQIWSIDLAPSQKYKRVYSKWKSFVCLVIGHHLNAAFIDRSIKPNKYSRTCLRCHWTYFCKTERDAIWGFD
jgi:hypothetical protein